MLRKQLPGQIKAKEQNERQIMSVLTGSQAHDKLRKAYDLVTEVQNANVVDCNNTMLLCISSSALQVRVTAGHIDSVYSDLYDNAKSKEDKTNAK
jgi:ACT domain-containing protein